MTEVTIIIPNYNGKKLLENCIKTLERQTCQEFKLLVIDNGSKDGSTDVTSESLYMEMVALPENTGFCGAVNLGFEMTTTPYAILLNNDTEAEPHFVEELLKGIRQSERIFSCGAQMLDFKQRELLDNAGDLYTLPGWAVARGKGRPAADYGKQTDVFSCCGGAVIYRMSVLWMKNILLILRISISVTVQGSQDTATVISRRQKCIMSGVRRQVRATMKKKYFLPHAIPCL